MALINFASKEITCKVVYYGPAMGGKTTNIEYIFQKISPESRSDMVSLNTDTDRTLFFDFLSLDLGVVAGYKTKFSLYTVPGQVNYNSSRKIVLNGVDGIVFVADSQIEKMEENKVAMKNMKENLQELGRNTFEIPWVIQYNKRDLPNIVSFSHAQEQLNIDHVPSFEATANKGIGVFSTLKSVSKMVLANLN